MIQNEIISLFDSSSENLELDIKSEVDPREDNIAEEMLDKHVEGVTDGSDELQNNELLQSKTSTNKFESPEASSSNRGLQEYLTKRFRERIRNPDKGLIVVEMDGEKLYQCEVCKKLYKNRSVLVTHRKIHSSTRDVCCTECGAMFKTLPCLHSHKKIHRERIYYHW